MDEHLDLEQLKAGLPHVLQSPKNHGIIELLVIRPAVGERKVVDEISINFTEGAAGDIWSVKETSSTKDRKPHPERQVTIMNSRCIDLIAGSKDRWPLAGDQVYVDMDLSDDNLPPGTLLQLGTAILKVSASPHNGCKKFAQRYGKDSMRFVNSPEGRNANLRGINMVVVKEGLVSLRDVVVKVKN